VKISPKRIDALQLRALSQALRSADGIASSMQAKFADALDRYLADDYAPRPNARPRKDERNAWLAVDYLIRCERPKATKMAESKDLSNECAKAGIKIDAGTIRKLPTKHPRAKKIAMELLERAEIFRDPHAAAIFEACGHWLRAEAGDDAGGAGDRD
jgi:hypothetical protein